MECQNKILATAVRLFLHRESSILNLIWIFEVTVFSESIHVLSCVQFWWRRVVLPLKHIGCFYDFFLSTIRFILDSVIQFWSGTPFFFISWFENTIASKGIYVYPCCLAWMGESLDFSHPSKCLIFENLVHKDIMHTPQLLMVTPLISSISLIRAIKKNRKNTQQAKYVYVSWCCPCSCSCIATAMTNFL